MTPEEFKSALGIELLFQYPETCIWQGCHSQRIAQRCVSLTSLGAWAKIVRLCPDHRLQSTPEVTESGLLTGRFFTHNELLVISEPQLAEKQCQGMFCVIDMKGDPKDHFGSGGYSQLNPGLMDEWRRHCSQNKKPCMFLYVRSYGFQIAWHPHISPTREIQNLPAGHYGRVYLGESEEGKRLDHVSRLYKTLRDETALQFTIDSRAQTMQTAVIKDETAALNFAWEVYKLEEIIRDDDLFQCSMVMDS